MPKLLHEPPFAYISIGPKESVGSNSRAIADSIPYALKIEKSDCGYDEPIIRVGIPVKTKKFDKMILFGSKENLLSTILPWYLLQYPRTAVFRPLF